MDVVRVHFVDVEKFFLDRLRGECSFLVSLVRSSINSGCLSNQGGELSYIE